MAKFIDPSQIHEHFFQPDNGERFTVNFRGKQITTNKTLEQMSENQLGVLKQICGTDKLYYKKIPFKDENEHQNVYNELLAQYCKYYNNKIPQNEDRLFTLTQSLYTMQILLSVEQIEEMFSVLTFEQLDTIKTRSKKENGKPAWF